MEDLNDTVALLNLSDPVQVDQIDQIDQIDQNDPGAHQQPDLTVINRCAEIYRQQRALNPTAPTDQILARSLEIYNQRYPQQAAPPQQQLAPPQHQVAPPQQQIVPQEAPPPYQAAALIPAIDMSAYDFVPENLRVYARRLDFRHGSHYGAILDQHLDDPEPIPGQKTTINPKTRVTLWANPTTFAPFLAGRNLTGLLPALNGTVFVELGLPQGYGAAVIGEGGANMNFLRNIEHVVWALVLPRTNNLVIACNDRPVARYLLMALSEAILTTLPLSVDNKVGRLFGDLMRTTCESYNMV